MNRMKAVFWGLPLAAALTACGGGGGAPGDVATFAVLPPDVTWTTTAATPCPGVAGVVSVHIINGGAAPFRVRGATGLEVGMAGPGDEFIPVALTDGYLVLTGRDPIFAVRATLGCPSDVTVNVLDNFSRPASVSIKVEAGS